MEMTSYDELLKQVRSLRAENSNLRQELNDNSSQLSNLETEASTIRDVMTNVPLDVDDDADNDINYDDENGIHVFQQGGGGEGRDLITSEEDISPNDIIGLKPFQIPPPESSKLQNGSAMEEREEPKSDRQAELREHMRMLIIERTDIITQMKEEDQQRKWYIAQLDNIRQKLEKIPYNDGYNRQSEAARRNVEYEAKQIQEAFEQNLGTHEQISHRQDARRQRIQVLEMTIAQLQQQTRIQMEGSSLSNSSQCSHPQLHNQQVNLGPESKVILPSDENGDTSIMDPNASMNIASLYHGAWPLSPVKKDSSNHSSREGSSQNVGQEVSSVMSFNSNSTHNSHPPGAPPHRQPGVNPLIQPQAMALPLQNQQDMQHPQQFGTKVEMVYSLLSMLGSNDKDDMSRTLLAMSSSQDSCIAMRQSGCLPLLIQLLHGSDKDSGLLGNTRGSKAARARAAAALHNIVHSHPDDKRGRREARVLRLLEQIRAHCDQLREVISGEDEDKDNKLVQSPTTEMDHHPGPAVAALMKLSFDEEHRHAICSLGGVQAIAELIQMDHEAVGNTSEQYNITMRRYGCMALTNLTFGDGTNKALLCSMRGFMVALVSQLESECEDLNQVAASVLRNLSWKADLQSKKTLRVVGASTTLMKAAMRVKKEPTLKSILSALWNLSAHGSENKADICAVENSLEFLVGTLTYKSPSKTTAVVENGGGVLRNISSQITVREDYRQILRKHGCLQILLKQLRSTSLNIVSNACGTLWNLSARCPEDQQALWDMGAVGMLRNLVHSKHQMISMGSSAALKNLLTACPSIKSTSMDKKTNSNRPTLHVRKQKALAEEIDHTLAETCENLESPRDSPTENNRTEKDNTLFKFPLNATLVQPDIEPRRPLARAPPMYASNNSGKNTPLSDSRLMSPNRVARSGSQDSVGSTHSDISHDRSRFHNAIKSAKQYHDRKGGSLDRHRGGVIQRINSDSSGEPIAQGNSRILQVMKEVVNYADLDQEGQKSVSSAQSQCSTPKKDQQFSLPHTLLYRSFTGPSQSFPNHVFSKSQNGTSNYDNQNDSNQPIDYSMKNSKKVTSVPPPLPIYDNYVGQSQDVNMINQAHLMQHSFQGHGMNASQNPFHVQHHIHKVVPVIPPFSAYAETDLDNDQPTDFSLKYAENHEYIDEQLVSYGNHQYEENDPNCADCKYEVARRTNELLEQYSSMPGYSDDQVKTFCTEGTPRNYLSTANSLTDLSNRAECKNKKQSNIEGQEEENSDDQDDEESENYDNFDDGTKHSGSTVNSQFADVERSSGTASISTNQDTPTTLIANYHVATKSLQQVAYGNVSNIEETESRNFHAPNVNDHSPDQVKTYCEEGTPICFSRVSSLSSLHSEYPDRQLEPEKNNVKSQKGLNRIDENESSKTPPRDVKTLNSIMAPPKYTPNTGRQKLLSESDSHGPDSAEKEHKTVTFNDDHQVQETPLMFSRCSSLGSLSSFDAQSVHSSVISDYSRRASEVVSPSELPDSPSETMPPSPSKSPVPIFKSSNQIASENSTDPPNITDEHTATPKTVLFRPKPTNVDKDKLKMKSMEVASTISCDEAPVIYADEGTPPHMSETNSVLSKLTIDDSGKKEKNQTVEKKNEDHTETEEDSNSLNPNDDKENSSMSEVSEGEEDILKKCMSAALPPKMRRSSSDNTIKKKNGGQQKDNPKSKQNRTNDGKISPNGKMKSFNGSISEQDDNEDTVKLFASEDIPAGDVREKIKQTSKPQLIAAKTLVEGSGDMVKSYAVEDLPYNEKSQRPKIIIPPRTTNAPIPKEFDGSTDCVRSYANEGMPSTGRKVPLSKPKHFGKIQEILRGNLEHLETEGDSIMSFAEEGTPFSGSVPISPNPQTIMPPIFGKFNPSMLAKIDNQTEDEKPTAYACEGTPYNMSEPTSPKQTLKKAPPQVMQKPKRIPTFSATPHFDPTLLSQIQDAPPEDELPKSYAVEDTPFTSEPASPKRDKTTVHNSNPSYRFLANQAAVIHAEPPCEDTVQTYATEDTPVSFSHATSLSDLSIMTTNEPISELPQENNKLTDESSVLVPEEPSLPKDESQIEVKEQESEENKENLDETQSDNSSLLDDSEDLLSDLIQSAMPKGKTSPKGRVSRKLDMDRAAEGAEASESQTSQSKKGFHPLRTSSVASQHPNTKPQANISRIPHLKSAVNLSSNMSVTSGQDMVRNYAVEDTPNNFSSATSLSNLTVDEMPSSIQQASSLYQSNQACNISTVTGKSALDDSVFYRPGESSDSLRVYNVEGTPQTFSRNDSLSSLSLIDEDTKDTTGSSGKKMPPPKTFSKPLARTSTEIEMQREVEGQSSDETKSVSNKSDSGKSIDEKKEQPVKYKVEDTPASFSKSSSLSNLSIPEEEKKDEDSDDDIDEALQDALLEECMNAALPKSKSRNFDEKPQTMPAVPTITNIPNKSAYLIKPDARKRSARASLDSNIQPEKTMQSVVQTKGKEYVFDKYKQHRMSRSCSSADEFENLNRSIGSVTTHDSRVVQWRRQQQQQAHNVSADFQFVKPSNDYHRVPPHHGSWRRSRSQDSDGFLKRQKDSSNMEIAQSGGRMNQGGNSQQSIPTYVNGVTYPDNRMVEEQHAYLSKHYNVSHYRHSQDQLSERGLDSLEKTDEEKSEVRRRSRHYSLPQNDELEMMNRSMHQREHNNEALMYSYGIDNFGFSEGSVENVQQDDYVTDSADITLQGYPESINNTIIHDEENQYQQILREDGLTAEDQNTLEVDASIIVTEIQNNRMMGSSVDEDMFIENETLSLVSGGYMSDTASDVSITWSHHSENYSESTTISQNEDSSVSSRPRIIKPSDKPASVEEMKGIRGRRKPLYSPRTPAQNNNNNSLKPNTNFNKGRQAMTQQGKGRGGANVNMGNKRTPTTKTHPQASSTPTKVLPPKMKLQKPSPPQNKSPSNISNNKSSPSRLPLASNKKGSNSIERPKPPVKQGTFTKQSSLTKNVPVIDLDNSLTDENGNDTSFEDDQCQKNTETTDSSWSQALASYNFIDQNEDKKENQAPKRRNPTVNTPATKKGINNNSRNNRSVANTQSKNSKLAKPSNTSTSNLRKAHSGTSLTKSGSGQSLHKSGSGASLNKTGSRTSLNKSVSGVSLNKASSDRILNRSNPNLGRKDLNKSDSNTSLKTNSRPTTPVGRKNSSQLTRQESQGSKVPQGSAGKKQVNSKIAGLWKKDDMASPRHSSKLPVSNSTPSRKKQQSVPNTGTQSTSGRSPFNNKTQNRPINIVKTESPSDGMSRSSTYDKIHSTNDSSQLPCLDDEETLEPRRITIQMSPSSRSEIEASEIKGDYVELRIIQGAESSFDPNKSIVISSPTKSDIRSPIKSDIRSPTKSEGIVSPFRSNMSSPVKSESLSSPTCPDVVVSPAKSDGGSSGGQSMSSSMSKSGDEFDLKSLEKRIDSNTWRKKKSDLDSSCLPNADETEKSLEAVKALLDASINSQNVTMNSTYSSIYSTSTVEGSYLSQGSRTIGGAAWRRYKEQACASVDQSEDEGESIWVRRDPESSKSEPELNKHLLNGKKGAKKEKVEGKSFLPIKAMKSMFSSTKKDRTSKSGSKMSLSSSKESLYNHKVDMNEIVKAVEKEKEKRDKLEDKRKQKEEKEKEKLEKEKEKLEKERIKEIEKKVKEKQKELEKLKQKEKEKSKEISKESKKSKVAEKPKFKGKEKTKDKQRNKSASSDLNETRKSVSSEPDEQSFSVNSSEVNTTENEKILDKSTLSSTQENRPLNQKTSPQAVIVSPFNYTPKESSKQTENWEKDDQCAKPASKILAGKIATTASSSPAQPMTKTEMLMARRQQSYLNSLNKSSQEADGNTSCTEKDKRGCMVTTV